MIPKDINDKLLIVYEKNSDKPLGTGFIINEFGHFITSYHVVKDCTSIKDQVRCEWKSKCYKVKYIQLLEDNGFYKALRNNIFPIDLIILELSIPDKNYPVEHLPTLYFDMNEQFHKPFEVSLSGFNCEKIKKVEKAKPSFFTITLTEYNKENGLWLFSGKNKIYKGYSGSPILHPQLGEIMGVVVRRLKENSQFGCVQSIHMLSDQLRSYGYDCELFFKSPFSLYDRYHKEKCNSFESRDPPYAIDKKEFVDAFDFKTGLFPLKAQWGLVNSNKCVIPFIVEQLKENPVFCVGYYGMGKTTISKFLFSKYSLYSKEEKPLYISLENKRLSEFNSKNWNDFIVEKIYNDFPQSVLSLVRNKVNKELIRQYVRHFLDYNKVILILDGIDEALWDRVILREFASVLKSLPYPYFLTSRMEFYAFFDVFGDIMGKFPHIVIELLPWGETQWGTYIGNLYEKYPEKSESIEHLEKALEKGEYGTLPERPLFLKMISDLELDNEIGIEEELPQQLRKNRAAVYRAYVRWKIKDDFVRKGVNIPNEYNKDDFADEAFRLFQDLANIEYSGSVPKKGAVGYLKGNAAYEDMQNTSAFTLKDIERACSQLDILDYKFVKKNILGSTFFSILKKEPKRIFRFSHKSFCEYLIGNNLASSIFRETVNEAKCGRAWDFYQTHEVSAHFQDEIDRIVKIWNIEKEDKKLYLQKAFEKVLLEKRNLRDYSERFEEVLYYTGRLEIESPEILRLLKKISTNPENVHPVYYRTAHLSLSMCENVKWCEKYVEYLIGNFHDEKQAFQLNSDIQINYYGKGNIRSVLKKDIEKFITGDDLTGILPLKIFSYFVCLPFDAIDLNSAREYLNLIKKTCEKRGHTRMAKIMNEILPILENVNRSN
jgi:hypothetical protein